MTLGANNFKIVLYTLCAATFLSCRPTRIIPVTSITYSVNEFYHIVCNKSFFELSRINSEEIQNNENVESVIIISKIDSLNFNSQCAIFYGDKRYGIIDYRKSLFEGCNDIEKFEKKKRELQIDETMKLKDIKQYKFSCW